MINRCIKNKQQCLLNATNVGQKVQMLDAVPCVINGCVINAVVTTFRDQLMRLMRKYSDMLKTGHQMELVRLTSLCI